MDLVILGGGIVGLALANILAEKTKLKITLIEAQIPNLQWDDTDYDLRCSAITRATENMLRSLELWDTIVAARVGVYDCMHVWDSATSVEINFKASEFGEPNLGHIIENRVLQRALWQKLITQQRVSIRNTKPTNLELHPQHNRLYFGSEYIDCKLIVGADGASSWLRGAVNIPVIRKLYQQHALVATIKSSISHQDTAMQCFTEDGPIAFLPLSDPFMSSIVWSTNSEKAQKLMLADADQFCALLAEEFQHKLGTLELCGKRATFPLQLMHAQSYIAQRIAFIGDAIHVVHPLAGQGLNMGISDALALADIIVSTTVSARDIGATNILRKYERQRKATNVAVLAAIDLIKRSFSIQNKYLINLRSWGVSMFNRSSWIKRSLALHALGINNE